MGCLISLGPNSVLTNGHMPDHRCYATSIYLYDLCQVRVVKLKAANKQIIVRSLSTGAYRSGQVPEGHLTYQTPQSQAAAGQSTLSEQPLDYKDPQGDTIPKYSNNNNKKTKQNKKKPQKPQTTQHQKPQSIWAYWRRPYILGVF